MGIKTCKTVHDMSCSTQMKWSLCVSLSSSDLGVTVIVAGNCTDQRRNFEGKWGSAEWPHLFGRAGWSLKAFLICLLGSTAPHPHLCVRLQWSQRRKTNASEDESEAIRPPTSDSTPTWGDLFDSVGTDSSVLSKVPQQECWLWIFD